MERSRARRFGRTGLTLMTASGCVALALALAAGSPSASAAVRGPSIKSVQPARVRAGKVITIRGHDLKGVTRVAIHGVAASFRIRSAGELTAVVPRAATSGRVTVSAARQRQPVPRRSR
jgi:hypothetical protein